MSHATALRWISGELRRCGIPFQAVGGLAVWAWGGRRALVDLDFYVPQTTLSSLRSALGDRVVRGPERLRSEGWDVTVLAVREGGTTVELGGADSARYLDRTCGQWRSANVGFDRSVMRNVLGETVPVMPKSELIEYKRALSREVDLIDLHELTGSGGPVNTRLAVYGSLAPGEVNQEVLAGLQGRWEVGTIRGTLYPEGWGMSYGFPALRWDPDAEPVPVRLFTSPALPDHWTRLDAFEGPGYQRALVPVTLAGNRTQIANVYLGRTS